MNDGEFAATMKEALKIRDRMKAEGHSRVEIDRYLEGVLRQSWPKGRTWHYLCDDCNDTGLIRMLCKPGQRCNGISTRTDFPGQKPGKYQRLCALNPDSDYEHDYCIPCFCKAGEKFKSVDRSAPAVDDAGKQPPRKPTRFGR